MLVKKAYDSYIIELVKKLLLSMDLIYMHQIGKQRYCITGAAKNTDLVES